jgi:hypothetical protein
MRPSLPVRHLTMRRKGFDVLRRAALRTDCPAPQCDPARSVVVVDDLGLAPELDRAPEAALGERAAIGVVHADLSGRPVRGMPGDAPPGLYDHDWVTVPPITYNFLRCIISSALPARPLTCTKASDTGKASIGTLGSRGGATPCVKHRTKLLGRCCYLVVAVRRRNDFIRGDR